MASILVTYATGDGQTAKVAEFVGSVLTDRGFDVTTRSVWDVDDSLVERADGVLVGASIHDQRHQPAVVAFVERNRDALAARPSAFFQLSFASALGSGWARAGAREWADSLFAATGWQPDRVGLFGGAVAYARYPFLIRQAFRLTSALTGGDTDTSRDYEYTDWEEVERFAAEFGDLVERRRGGPLAGRILDKALPALAVLGLALGGYWFSRRREATRQETLDEFDERATRESQTDRDSTDAAEQTR